MLPSTPEKAGGFHPEVAHLHRSDWSYCMRCICNLSLMNHSSYCKACILPNAARNGLLTCSMRSSTCAVLYLASFLSFSSLISVFSCRRISQHAPHSLQWHKGCCGAARIRIPHNKTALCLLMIQDAGRWPCHAIIYATRCHQTSAMSMAAYLLCELLLLLLLSHVVLIYWVKIAFVKAFHSMTFPKHLLHQAD